MKKFLALVTGTALAGGMAVAQQQQDPVQDPTQDPMDQTQEQVQEQTSEYGEEVGEWDQRDPMSQTEEPIQTEDPTMGETETQESTTYGQESTTDDQESTTYGQESTIDDQESTIYSQEMEMEHGLSDMSAEELKGTTVVTTTGEEIGEIDRIGDSEEHQERVATVDVGGFLGVAEKTIAIPLSELEMSSDGNVQTTLTKETIESREEFDEQGFTEEASSEDTGY